MLITCSQQHLHVEKSKLKLAEQTVDAESQHHTQKRLSVHWVTLHVALGTAKTWSCYIVIENAETRTLLHVPEQHFLEPRSSL